MTIDQAFEILEITDRNIDELSLKKAFREAARNTHPDSNPSDKAAEDKFRQINEAYDLLLPEIRKQDRLRAERKKRAEKARRVENVKRTGKADDSTKAWEQPKNGQTKQTGKDRWDYYAEADRKYNEERKKNSRDRVDEALRKKERLDALREAQEKWERERAERMEREKEPEPEPAAGTDSSENSPKEKPDKNIIIDFITRPLGVEAILVMLLSVFAIGVLISTPFYGMGRVSTHSRYIATAMCWVIVFAAATKIANFARKYFRGKIELIIVFLVALELGLSFIKLMDIVLQDVRNGLAAVLIIVVALLIECTYIRRIRESLNSDIRLQRMLAVFIVVSDLAVALAGIILGIIGLL